MSTADHDDQRIEELLRGCRPHRPSAELIERVAAREEATSASRHWYAVAATLLAAALVLGVMLWPSSAAQSPQTEDFAAAVRAVHAQAGTRAEEGVPPPSLLAYRRALRRNGQELQWLLQDQNHALLPLVGGEASAVWR